MVPHDFFLTNYGIEVKMSLIIWVDWMFVIKLVNDFFVQHFFFFRKAFQKITFDRKYSGQVPLNAYYLVSDQISQTGLNTIDDNVIAHQDIF